MSFALIREDEHFELYTDIKQIRDGKTGQDFQKAVKNAVPHTAKRFDRNKRCQIIQLTYLPEIKSLCEIYFKDDWKTKDRRLSHPGNHVRYLMQLNPNCSDSIVRGYYNQLNNTSFLNIDSTTLKESYDRAFR